MDNMLVTVIQAAVLLIHEIQNYQKYLKKAKNVDGLWDSVIPVVSNCLPGIDKNFETMS